MICPLPTRLALAGGLLCILALSPCCSAWGQQARSLSVQAYRTEISPGSPEEDALFIARLVPHLARLMFGEFKGDGLVYESVDVDVKRRHSRGLDGQVVYNPEGRAVVEAEHNLTIRGDRFYSSALAFLNWRKGFELKWVHDASPEHVQLEPTPFQLIHDARNLTDLQKIGQILYLYNLHHRAPVQAEAPKPEYWPTSPILDIESVGVQVLFNVRGGIVTILHPEESRVWQLPFPAGASCEKWMRLYEQVARSEGLDKAAERMRTEASKMNAPPQ